MKKVIIEVTMLESQLIFFIASWFFWALKTIGRKSQLGIN